MAIFNIMVVAVTHLLCSFQVTVFVPYLLKNLLKDNREAYNIWRVPSVLLILKVLPQNIKFYFSSKRRKVSPVK